MTFALSAVVLVFLGMWKAVELVVRAAERFYDWRIERRYRNRRLSVVVPRALVLRGRR